jgi:hypothetical protein
MVARDVAAPAKLRRPSKRANVRLGSNRYRIAMSDLGPVCTRTRTLPCPVCTSHLDHFRTPASQRSKPYSITSSARASTDACRSRPSALAVFKLTTSSSASAPADQPASLRPLISAIMGHAGAAPMSASSSSKARTKLPGGPRRGLGLSLIGRQMPALLSFTFLDLKCGSASSRAVPRV